MPCNWDYGLLGDLVDIRTEKIVPEPGDPTPYIGLEHIAQGEPKLLGIGRAGEVVSHKTIFRAGDVLYGKLRPALRKVVRAHFDGVCSTDILVLMPRCLSDGQYILHLLHSERFVAHAVQSAAGTKMPRASWADLESFRFRCPPSVERQGIATVLDSIDTAIERTEAVTAATQDLRRALLQDLLTHGVPGWHSEFKHVPGIGTVPTGWEVCLLEQVAEVQTGRQVGKVPAGEDVLELPYLAVLNVKDGYLDLSTVKMMQVATREVERFSLRSGDVLFTEGGDADKLGRGCVWSGEITLCLHQNHIFAVRPHADRLRPEFLSWYARSRAGKNYFLGCAKQTTNLASINSAQLRRFPIPVPSLIEQDQIIEAVRVVPSAEWNLEALRALKGAVGDALLSGRVRVPAALAAIS